MVKQLVMRRVWKNGHWLFVSFCFNVTPNWVFKCLLLARVELYDTDNHKFIDWTAEFNVY